MVTPKVSVGVGTLVGYGLTLVGGAATAWATAEGAGSQLSPGLLAALTFAAGILTTLGRQYQGKPAVKIVEPLPQPMSRALALAPIPAPLDPAPTGVVPEPVPPPAA